MRGGDKERRGSKGGLNYGHWLYEQGVIQKEERKKLYEQARQERENLDPQECTFAPSINPKSRQVSQSSQAPTPESRLLLFGQALQERKEQQQATRALETQRNCPFRPTINHKYVVPADRLRSHKLAVERSKTLFVDPEVAASPKGQQFEVLFEDARRRQASRESVARLNHDSECTFRPNIRLTQQHAPARALTAQRTRSRLQPSSEVDPRTGQPLFRPRVGRLPRNPRNLSHLPIGEYLYVQEKQKEERRQQQAHIRKQAEQALAVPQIQDTSCKLIQGRKVDLFIELFTLLHLSCVVSTHSKF